MISKSKKNKQIYRILKSNSGVTIMEMLVVLVLIAILSGLVGLTYQYIHNANVQKAGENLAAALRTARTTSMSKGTEKGRLNLISEGGRLYYTIGDSTEKQEICNQVMGFCIYTTKNAGSTSLAPTGQTGDCTITIRFTAAGMLDNSAFGSNYVVFFKGNRAYSVLVYPETGKIEQTLFYY